MGNQSPVQPTTPQPNTPAPAQANPVDDHAKLYTKFLRQLTPPTTYIDPQGNVQTLKQNAPSMGKTILSAVLAGMFATPNQYVDTPYGKRIDASATTAAAMANGAGVVAKQNADAQALSDKQQAIKLSNIKNSIDQVHLMAALTQQRHQELQGVLDSNQPALDDFKAMDDKQADPSKKIILSEPMTFQQAMDSPLYGKGKMTTNSILMSGRQSVYDPETGETHEVPLFTILSPEAGGVTISEDQKKNFSTINRSFDGMGGLDARIPIHQYLALQGNLTSVQHFQSFIKRADEQLGIKEDADLAAAVKKDPTLINGIRAAENALAQGGSTADTLQRIQHGTDGKVNWDSSKLFSAMGLDQDKVAQYIREDQRERARQDAADKEAGKLALQKAKPITFATAASIANDEDELPARRQQAQAVIKEQENFEAKKDALKAQYEDAKNAAKDNPNMMTGSLPDGTQVAGTVDELKAAGIDPKKVTKLPAADSSKVSIARQLISPNGLLTNTLKDIAAFKPEELTAIGNRWNEFDAGTLGQGDPRYIALRTDARLLSTALMQAHVGSRGSEAIMEHFGNLADAGKMNGETLKTAIDTEKRYVTEKAMLPKAATAPQFTKWSSDGKYGWNGTAWVSTTGAR